MKKQIQTIVGSLMLAILFSCTGGGGGGNWNCNPLSKGELYYGQGRQGGLTILLFRMPRSYGI